MPAIPDPVPCNRGYHLCRDAADLLKWLGPTIWVAEVDGKVVAHRDKVVAERARLLRRLPWDERTAREFAADCAERALAVYEAAYPGDDRPRRAVEVARAYARGEATRDELSARAAACAAAWAAEDSAEDAAWAAAEAAAWAAGEDAIEAAVWAAEDAAWAAARAAAAAAGAAEAAERRWQAARLAELLGIDPPREHGGAS